MGDRSIINLSRAKRKERDLGGPRRAGTERGEQEREGKVDTYGRKNDPH